SISAGAATLASASSRSIRLAKPVSTLPEPISTSSVTPCCFIASTLSRQRTSDVTCSTRRRRIAAGSTTGAAVTLAISGTTGAATGISPSAARRGFGHGALHGGAIAADHDLAGAIIVGDIAHLALRRDLRHRTRGV